MQLTANKRKPPPEEAIKYDAHMTLTHTSGREQPEMRKQLQYSEAEVIRLMTLTALSLLSPPAPSYSHL